MILQYQNLRFFSAGNFMRLQSLAALERQNIPRLADFHPNGVISKKFFAKLLPILATGKTIYQRWMHMEHIALGK